MRGEGTPHENAELGRETTSPGRSSLEGQFSTRPSIRMHDDAGEFRYARRNAGRRPTCKLPREPGSTIHKEFRSRKVTGWGLRPRRPATGRNADCGYDKARCGNTGPSHFSLER